MNIFIHYHKVAQAKGHWETKALIQQASEWLIENMAG